MSRAMTMPLYRSDAEIIAELNVGEKAGRVALRDLERHPRFPKKDPLFSNKRYWPAVKAFLDWRGGITSATAGAPAAPDGMENFNDKAQSQKARLGPASSRGRAGRRVATSR